jgi:hypothetical protein
MRELNTARSGNFSAEKSEEVVVTTSYSAAQNMSLHRKVKEFFIQKTP